MKVGKKSDFIKENWWIAILASTPAIVLTYLWVRSITSEFLPCLTAVMAITSVSYQSIIGIWYNEVKIDELEKRVTILEDQLKELENGLD